jgi:hypothetical protein
MGWPEDEIRDWLMAAADNTGCSVEMLPRGEDYAIVARLFSKYVNEISNPGSCEIGNPGSWWMGLKLPYVCFHRSEKKTSDILPSLDGFVHLLPEAPRLAFVYRIKAVELETILDDCPGFEYVVASEDGSWLMTENHHDMFYLCKAADRELLKG